MNGTPDRCVLPLLGMSAEDLLPSPWDWVPAKGLVLTRAYALLVKLTPSSASARFTSTAWELKKALRALCPAATPPLLLDATVGKTSAEVHFVFPDAAAAQVKICISR